MMCMEVLTTLSIGQLLSAHDGQCTHDTNGVDGVEA